MSSIGGPTLRLVTFNYKEKVNIGAWSDGRIVDLSNIAPDMITLITMGKKGLVLAEETAAKANTSFATEEVLLMAPIPHPRRNVMCLGLNYAEHAQETSSAEGRSPNLPDAPIVFTKATTAVSGPYDAIPVDPLVSEKIDWEAELAFIVGHEGKNIAQDQAMDYVYGYAVLNDVSARDLQQRGKQFFKGKSLDGCCPMGPWILTADEMADPGSLRITCRVNGEIKQDSSTSLMIFDIPAIVSYISRGMTLLPGDIIATGTPAGVGFARTPPEFLKVGDVVECEIEGIGSIRNNVASTS
jgi:2-keto-4-pentenoate hydratase/2-oxohepta-3-ene-1,7-dioic acid hydratase in catechol pathway